MISKGKIGLASVGIGSLVSYLDAPGAGMLIGFGVAWFAFSRICEKCRSEKQ